MSVSDSQIKAAQDKVGQEVLSKVRSPNVESPGEEPPSGIQGKGTADQPYDQGNQPAQDVAVGTEGTGTEPPSGQKGAGTAGEPYDQGNQPEQNNTMSIVDQLSRTKTKEEIKQQKERRMSRAQEKGNPPPLQEEITQSTPAVQTAQSQSTPTVTVNGEPEPNRGRAQTGTSTTSTAQNAPPSMKDMPKSTRQIERSVSPGQLADGSHVRCSGEKGETYSPPHGIGRIKGKLFH